jgi:CRP/FNR family cyclic AMP-dependent transcriptional regulator
MRQPGIRGGGSPAHPVRMQQLPARARAQQKAHAVGENLRRHFRAEGLLLKLGRGAAVYSAGQVSEHLYLIETGCVKVQRTTEAGKSCVLGMHGAGEVVGESSLFEDRRSQSAVALGPALARRLPRRRFLELMAARELREDWLRYLAHRNMEHERARTLFVTVDSEHRLAAVVLELSSRHGRPRSDARLLVAHRFTQEELAEIVGTTRSRVGLFLRRFQDMGLLLKEPTGRLLVDQERLEQYLAERQAS